MQEDLKVKDIGRAPEGDFLTNGDFLVFRCENKISFHKLGRESEATEVTAEKKIVAMTMKWPHVVTLHDDSFSVANFSTQSIHKKGQSTNKLISIDSNSSIVAILNSINDVLFYRWAGKFAGNLMKRMRFIFSLLRLDTTNPITLLSCSHPTTPPPHLPIQPPLHIPV